MSMEPMTHWLASTSVASKIAYESKRGALARACAGTILFTALSGLVSGQVTERVSVDSSGAQANGAASLPSISADRRFVAFTSDATNLVPGDTNGLADIFVYDRLTGTTERVNVDSGGLQALGGISDDASISADGRYVAFGSDATNLVPGDTNARFDAFVRDRQSGTTERVSVTSGAVEGNDNSGEPSISADGRYVAFESFATNLVPGDSNGTYDIFVRDRQSGTTERVSVATGGAQANSNSRFPSIAANGLCVAFWSQATNLVPGDTNGFQDVFIRDRLGATTERVSVASGGAQANDISGLSSISADGRYVAFESPATNLVPGDTNALWDAFLRDRLLGTTERVSVASNGTQGNGHGGDPSISTDGRYVAFESAANNLVSGDTNGTFDIFVRDRLAGTTERVSIDSLGTQGDGSSLDCSISPDGRCVAFQSAATNLVAGDTNSTSDIFVRDSGAGRTERESTGPGGAQGDSDSSGSSISADDRFVAFESLATNLVVGDTNGSKDIFVRDRDTGAVERVSVSSGGTEGNGDSSNPAISSDGRFVAFDSVANNLVVGDTNALADVFVRDRQLGTTARVSIGSEGNGDSVNPSISAAGTVIAFESAATNLVAGDTNAALDVFVRDLVASTTTRASVGPGGVQGNGDSINASISANGLLVAFESAANNLVTGDSNLAADVFVRDFQTASTTRVSVDSGGTQGAGASTDPSISSDGRYVAFSSAASNLVPGDSNLTVDVFRRDRQSPASTVRVSVDSGGTQGASASTDPSISSDGRHVAFASVANNLVPGDTNLTMDVFVRDTQLASTARVSVDSGGTQGLGSSSRPSISADGRHVAFDSDASNLVIGDTNGFTDVFVRDGGVASAFESFCLGDGTGAPCPCNNSGTSGRGCQNSGSTGGALLTVTGVASLSADTVQFTSSGERPTSLSIFLQGSATIAPIIYGDGLRCTGGNLKRLYTKTAVGGVTVAPQTGELSISARSAQLNAPIPLGATRPYQVYYRDGAAGFCPDPPGSSFNVSNGFLVAWGG